MDGSCLIPMSLMSLSSYECIREFRARGATLEVGGGGGGGGAD